MDYGLGVFYRYYLTSMGNWIPFVHAYVNGGSGRTRTSGFYYATGSSQTYSGRSADRGFYNLGINAGLTRKLNRNTGLDLMIGYGHSYASMTTTTQSEKTTTTGTVSEQYVQPQAFRGNALNIGIGLQVFLVK